MLAVVCSTTQTGIPSAPIRAFKICCPKGTVVELLSLLVHRHRNKSMRNTAGGVATHEYSHGIYSGRDGGRSAGIVHVDRRRTVRELPVFSERQGRKRICTGGLSV